MLLPMTRSTKAAIALGIALFLPAVALAQPMGQGEARITARSDVRLGIESGPGTHGARLQSMVDAITAKLGTIRGCYATIAEARPTVTGSMRVRAILARGARRIELRTEETSVQDAELDRCVRRALEGASYADVSRPANVQISLEFTNTAAAGIERTQERTAREGQVRVTHDSDGNATATGGTPEVHFRVVGGASADDQVAAVHRSVRASIAGLLDCRRRAGRRGMDPSGEIHLQLAVTRQGHVTARSVRSTVHDDRAPACVTRSLGRAEFERAAAGRSQLVLTFAAAAEIAEAHDD